MKLYLAPMEGVTSNLYRKIFAKYYQGVDVYMTPFLSFPDFGQKEFLEVDPAHNEYGILIPQIMANNADTFLEIAAKLKDMGYTHVNLNAGCPSKTVFSKRKGSGLLYDTDVLVRLLDGIFEKCDMEISVKTRIGVQDESEWEDILSIYNKFPIKELMIHPRLQREFYQGSVHLEAYQYAIEHSKNPICYNGDIVSRESLYQIEQQIGKQEHIMIGRGLIANPELARQIKADEGSFDKAKFIQFHDEIMTAYGEYLSGETPLLFKMKELWGFWAGYLMIDKKMEKEIKKSKNMSAYKSTVSRILLAI